MYTNLPVIRTPRGGQVSHTTGASRLSLSGHVLFVMCKSAEVIPEGAKLPSPAAAVACTKLFGGRSYVSCNETACPLTKSLPNLCQVETVLHAKLWMHRSFCIYTFIKHTRNIPLLVHPCAPSSWDSGTWSSAWGWALISDQGHFVHNVEGRQGEADGFECRIYIVMRFRSP